MKNLKVFIDSTTGFITEYTIDPLNQKDGLEPPQGFSYENAWDWVFRNNEWISEKTLSE